VGITPDAYAWAKSAQKGVYDRRAMGVVMGFASR
jgi:hypothetical protein